MKIKKGLICLTLAITAMLASCESDNNTQVEQSSKNNEQHMEKYTDEMFALDTYITFLVYADSEEDAQVYIDAGKNAITTFENVLSKTVEGSFTYELNKNKQFDLTDYEYKDQILYLIEKSSYYNEITDGMFDVTIEPLVSVWDFGGEPSVPTDYEITTALQKVDINNIVVDGNIVTLLNDATVDFGAIAKGYIGDLTKKAMVDAGATNGIINLGGNVVTIGEKPEVEKWIVGVQDPESTTGTPLGSVEIVDETVVTSGIYERNFTDENGNFYHHILDKTTGYPAENDLYSATIIAKESIDADALSTGVFLLGVEKGLELINSIDGVECMFVTKDEEFIFSDNFEKKYNFQKLD